MSWTKEFQTACKDAKSLSDISDFKQLVELADTVGQELQSDQVSSRQIRVLLSETTSGISRIRRGTTLGIHQQNPDAAIQNKAAQREAALLNISLVYNAGRDKSGSGTIRKLTELLSEMTKHVHTFEDFKVLRKFSEAVVAYFKFYGGK